MPTNTRNLNLIKPAGSEPIQISQINQNMDILDSKIGAVGNVNLQTQIDNNYNSILNKLLTPQAFSGNCNDLTYTGIVYVTDMATNSPGPWMFLNTIAYSNDTLVQIAYSVIDSRIKIRKGTNPWTAWRDATGDSNYLFESVTTLTSFINTCETQMGSNNGMTCIGFINHDAAQNIGLPTSGYIVGLKHNNYSKIIYYNSTNDETYSIQKNNGTWDTGWLSNSQAAKFYRAGLNLSDYTINLDSSDVSRYRLAVLFQFENGHPAMHLISFGVGTTPPISVFKIFGDTYSHSPVNVSLVNNTLTINYNEICYGGISLLWLN